MSARILLATVVLAAATPLGSQTPVSGTFVSTLGVDTAAVERYTRTRDKLEGDILLKYPRVRIIHYVADLGAGRFKGMSLSTRRVGADPTSAPTFSMVTLIGDTSATVEVQRAGKPDTANTGRRSFRVGRVAPAVPSEPPSFGLYEQMLAFGPPTTVDSVIVTTIGAGTGANSTITLSRHSRDSVYFNSSFFPGWIERASVDAAGRITGVDATLTTVKTMTRRAPEMDFDAVAKSWAAVETAKGAAGQMSPPDTVRATVGTANVQIDYSRPLKRGRPIFGNVVPMDHVWRTGANAATQLTTSADMVFGTTVVPAGKYTLWTLPSATGAKLIINKQTGQWGTDYDSSKDFARIDLVQSTLAASVEQFTIAIIPQAGGGTIRMQWDNRDYSIPFRLK